MKPALVARKLRRQFVHIDIEQGPQFADGDRISEELLAELHDDRKVEVVATDLIGRPMQFAAPGTLGKRPTKKGRR